ncbi:MAG: amino acid ABC transporter permease [Rhodospirillales bacterium]|nr:amino acid ABC transporter permease [Rhodospirillales bacterium]
MFTSFDRTVLANSALLLNGLSITAYTCAIAFLLAVFLGLATCMLRLYVAALRPLAIAYIEFCRATPIFVQLLWVNYVWPTLLGFPRTAEGAGIIALALQSSGYLAETFRSGIQGFPRGQYEAALALGISRPTIALRIVAPQVLLMMAPAVVNQMAVVVKSSTLVSVIAIPDLMYEALRIVDQWLEPTAILTTAALLYFLVIFTISTCAERIATRFRTRFGLPVTG